MRNHKIYPLIWNVILIVNTTISNNSNLLFELEIIQRFIGNMMDENHVKLWSNKLTKQLLPILV